ncbi:hypothetical protein BDW59DRAFT_123443 [Aspergillus cavernicola]|uniref:Uncharacterized protein n=1 Tax=Aspergillus cavernicola TaxID=176166 RepID=A0ABR4HVE3_9EURO
MLTIMVSFLGEWSADFLATVLPLVLGAFFDNPSMRLSCSAFLLLIGIGISRTFYWLVLYSRFFSPFRQLPTPSKRSPFTGNQVSLFKVHIHRNQQDRSQSQTGVIPALCSCRFDFYPEKAQWFPADRSRLLFALVEISCPASIGGFELEGD